MDYEVVKECTVLSDEGKITFPQVIRRLLETGVERYYADLVHPSKTYYDKHSAYTVESSHKHGKKVSDSFQVQGVISAIRQIQSGEILYGEFIRKIMESGVAFYIVFLKGRKVIYFGKLGEQHVEEFPK